MPYHIGKSGKCSADMPHAVIKDDDGKVMGCHMSEADAKKQMAALHVQERSSSMATDHEPAVEPEAEAALEKMQDGDEGVRGVAGASLREEGDGTQVLEGRMMPYDEWTEVNNSVEGHFMERFAPGSLAKTMRERAARIRVLFEHGLDFLGRQSIAAGLQFEDRDDGAYYDAALFRSVPELIVEGLRHGTYGSSIRFRPIKWERTRSPEPSEHNPDGLPEHTIREAFVKEFSVVSFPQYEGATAAVRSLTDELSVGRLLKDPERLIEVIRQVAVHEPQHSEPAPAEPDEGPGPEKESRRTRPSRDYLSDEEGEQPWRL